MFHCQDHAAFQIPVNADSKQLLPKYLLISVPQLHLL